MSLYDMMDILQLSCMGHKGGYIAYSQGASPTANVIAATPYTAGGICQALAAKWIVQHANDDSLWNWLYLPGTRTINKGCILQLMHNFIDGVARDGRSARHANPTTRFKYPLGMTYQDYVTERYMGLFGVKRRQMVANSFLGNQHHMIGTGNDGYCLANRLRESFLNAKGGSYVLIVIKGSYQNEPVGHAMSAFVGETDIAFFDPNFGEFWFPTKDDFTAWFRGYWSTSEYNTIFRNFYLLPYGKAAW